MTQSSFKVHVTKDYLKFNAAHFIAYPGFREALHGHNYRVSVDIEGRLSAQGYVVDFGIVKKAARAICDRLNERLILPMQSDCLGFRVAGPQIFVRYEEDEFSFPLKDVIQLPIIHSSAEELARYFVGELRRELAAIGVVGMQAIEVGIAETPGQAAYYREVIEDPCAPS